MAGSIARSLQPPGGNDKPPFHSQFCLTSARTEARRSTQTRTQALGEETLAPGTCRGGRGGPGGAPREGGRDGEGRRACAGSRRGRQAGGGRAVPAGARAAPLGREKTAAEWACESLSSFQSSPPHVCLLILEREEWREGGKPRRASHTRPAQGSNPRARRVARRRIEPATFWRLHSAQLSPLARARRLGVRWHSSPGGGGPGEPCSPRSGPLLCARSCQPVTLTGGRLPPGRGGGGTPGGRGLGAQPDKPGATASLSSHREAAAPGSKVRAGVRHSLGGRTLIRAGVLGKLVCVGFRASYCTAGGSARDRSSVSRTPSPGSPPVPPGGGPGPQRALARPGTCKTGVN